MLSEYVREHYLKIKLLKKTPKKQIWLLKNTLDGELVVGKLQVSPVNESKYARNVLHEGKFMQMTQGHSGIPFLHWAGKEDEQGIILIIVQRLGDTLQDKFNSFGPFSLKTVCLLGIQMIQILIDYHEKGLVHGNIKLNTFQFGIGKHNLKLFLNDFLFSHSCAKKVWKGKREVARNKQPFDQFMSIDRMLGYQSSKRDDIEAVVLILIYLLKGKLPWSASAATISSGMAEELDSRGDTKNNSLSKQMTSQDSKLDKVRVRREEKEKMIEKLINKIEETPVSVVCQGVPSQLANLLTSIRQIKYDQKPDYNHCIRSLRKLLLKNHWEEDGMLDWLQKDKGLSMNKLQTQEGLAFSLAGEEDLLRQYYWPYCEKVQLI